MSKWTNIRNAVFGFFKPVIAVAAAISPQVKALATALGVGSLGYATVTATIPTTGTLEERVLASVIALATSGISYVVHKLFYMAKDLADNGKLDKSASAD
jgi:hypothetical protein